MKDEDKPDEMVPIMLVGDQVNLDLIRLNGLHVRVQGRLLAGDEAAKRYPNLIDKGLTGLALEVTRFEKARPDETKDVYSGQIRMETFEGQEAAIFSDTLSGKEYVLADSLTITYTLEMYRQQAQKGETLYAIGVIVADKAFAGRPILRLLETRSSTGNPEEVIRVMRAELDNPIQDVGLVNEGPQDVIIDRVELAYVFQPPPLRAPEGFASSPTELVYELTGHSSDGRFTVTYDLEATSPTTPAMLRPTLSSMPTPTKSDLGKLVYVQVGDIWVKSLPDGQPQRLTTDGHNHEPRWSPSGQWLAFRGSDSRVWLIRADGSAKHSLSEGNPVKDFTWAPNVDRLAYTLDDGALSVVGADGSDRQAFVMPNSRQPITGVESLAWSPDGQWLAFARFEILTEGAPPDRYDSVWRIRADGGEAAELLNAGRPSDREFILAGWSSDSSTILLWINPGYSSSILADGVRLYALPIKGGSTLQLAAELETGAVPQEETVLYHSDFIAPARANFDASQIALTVGGYRATWENKRIGIADVPTGKIRLLTPKDQSAFSPDWSPDGTHLAYVAMPDKGDLVGGEDARLGMMSRRIYIVNTQGDPPSKPLTNDPAYRDEHPLWSADGSFILFARMNHENRASVWLVSAEGGEPQRIVDELTPAPEWFGYYGYIDWNDLFDWSRGPTH
jgi:Tol biopolymer transport system component